MLPYILYYFSQTACNMHIYGSDVNKTQNLTSKKNILLFDFIWPYNCNTFMAQKLSNHALLTVLTQKYFFSY